MRNIKFITQKLFNIIIRLYIITVIFKIIKNLKLFNFLETMHLY